MSGLEGTILDELEWRGALVGDARARVERALGDARGILWALVEAGVPDDEALLAVSQASGVAVAPKRLVDAPDPPDGAERFATFDGVAIGKRGDLPCVAFDDPAKVAAAQKRGAPPFVGVLVLPSTMALLRESYEEQFGAPKTKAIDPPLKTRLSADATDPDSAARVASEAGPSLSGAPPVDDDLFDDEADEAATVVNDVGALAAAAQASAPAISADPRSSAFTDERSVEALATQRAAPAVTRDPFDEAPTTRSLVDDDAGIDPKLLAAVVVEELQEKAGGLASLAPSDEDDVDPATVLTRPFTPDDEARYGAMKTTALKLHVDKEISVPSEADEDLFSDEGGASLLEEADSADVYDASSFERDPLEAQSTVAVPTTDSQIATQHLAVQSGAPTGGDLPQTKQVSREDLLAGLATIVAPPRKLEDSTRPTPLPSPSRPTTPTPRANDPRSPARGSHDDGRPKTGPRPKSESGSAERAVPSSEGRYQSKSVLGRGGMATVYLAHDRETGADVALKILEAHLASDETFIERFRREMRATENLDHENIIRCFDAGEFDGNYYIAAEYVDAGTLSQLLKSMGSLPVPVVVGVMEQALKGLQYAHETGTVHRDLKPANLMFNKKGVLKIGDFGIAKSSTDTTITQTGTLFGTPAYMSPEQAMGKDIDTRSDLFSIGIVFYQLLTGENPFHFDNPSTSLFRISSGMYPPLFDRVPEVPHLLDDVITRLLSRDRTERFPDAASALKELSPLIRAVRSRHQDLEARLLADPKSMGRMLREDHASLHVAHGRVWLDAEQPRLNEGIFHMFLASRVDSKNYEATNTLAQYRIDHQVRFDHPDDGRIDELEHAMGITTGENKCTPAQLRRAVDLHQPHKDLYGMARYLRRYLRMMPTDTHMQMRMRELVGSDPLSPFSPVPKVPKAEGAPPSEDEVAVVVPAGQIRRKADPRGGLPARAARASIVEERRATSGPSAPSPSSELAPAAPATSEGGEQPAEPTEPAKDSYEALQRAARKFWIETVRSVTGDRGVEGLREWWDDRFGKASREELKAEARDLLQASKNVLTEGQKKLLAETKKESFRDDMRALWSKHRRLIVTVGGILFAYSLLSYGCSVLFSDDDDAPRPDPPNMPAAE